MRYTSMNNMRRAASDNQIHHSLLADATRRWLSHKAVLPAYDNITVTDDEVIDLIRSVPTHFGVVHTNAQSNTGTCTATAPAGPGVVWNLTSLQISQAGPTVGANAKVTIYDGAVGGTVLYAAYLSAPGAGFGGSLALGSSVGINQDIPLPKTPSGIQCLQGNPGNAMNIQVTGTGQNNVSINARFSDGLPTGP